MFIVQVTRGQLCENMYSDFEDFLRKVNGKISSTILWQSQRIY